jgi:hypothetical protein
MDSNNTGVFTETGVLIGGASSTAGRNISITGTLRINDGSLHSMTADIHIFNQGTDGVYCQRYIGDFDDTTFRQGLKFNFSSGNVATGTLSVWGVKKQ